MNQSRCCSVDVAVHSPNQPALVLSLTQSLAAQRIHIIIRKRFKVQALKIEIIFQQNTKCVPVSFIMNGWVVHFGIKLIELLRFSSKCIQFFYNDLVRVFV
jgi:hypothetical protein